MPYLRKRIARSEAQLRAILKARKRIPLNPIRYPTELDDERALFRKNRKRVRVSPATATTSAPAVPAASTPVLQCPTTPIQTARISAAKCPPAPARVTFGTRVPNESPSEIPGSVSRVLFFGESLSSPTLCKPVHAIATPPSSTESMLNAVVNHPDQTKVEDFDPFVNRHHTMEMLIEVQNEFKKSPGLLLSYRILNVPYTVAMRTSMRTVIPEHDVKNAFKTIARIHHPDRKNLIGVSEEYRVERFKLALSAYRYLMDRIRNTRK